MAAVRARETVIENTVIDVIAAKIAITESEDVLMRGVARLKELGENPESITELCQMSLGDVKAALASAKEMAGAVVVPRTRTHEAVARAQGHSDV
jgi:alanine dehydrogenase